MERDEVLIVGAGASGAAMAWKLAEAGIRVTCLDQGGWVAPGDARTRDADWELHRFTDDSAYPNLRRNPWDYPVADADTPIKPLMFNGVGGSTATRGGRFPRCRPSDFRVRNPAPCRPIPPLPPGAGAERMARAAWRRSASSPRPGFI